MDVSKVTNASSVIWVDPILEAQSKMFHNNNYLIYAVTIEISKRAMYNIKWHRNFSCGDVDCVAACNNNSHITRAPVM